MNIQMMKDILDMMRERATRPLYNPLESGFRHSPLSPTEKIKRYEEFAHEILDDCNNLFKELSI